MPNLEVPGARLSYAAQGDGAPLLLFVHGFACTHEDWQAQIAFFARHRRVATCDLRAHGASSGAPDNCDIETYGADVSALLQALRPPAAVLIGHSLGCRVILQAYLQAPEAIAGLVLIDGSRVGSGDPHMAEEAMRRLMQTTGYSTMMRSFFADMFFEGSAPALKDRIIDRALDLPEAIGAVLFPRLLRWDAQHMDLALSQVSVPVLVIQSTYVDSRRVRVSLQPGASTPWLELVRHHVPQAHIEIVGGAGHFTMLDAPEVVNRLIEAFVATIAHPRR